MNYFNQGWFVTYTKPRHEKKIAQSLADYNIDHYVPTKKVFKVWHDRRKFVDVPLFPSYVFVYLKSLQDYYEVLNVDGAINYVRFGKEVARISNRVIEDVRLLIEHSKDVEVHTGFFQAGQQLFIKKGPLAGVSCEVVQVNNKQKVLVRLSLLQRNLLVTLSADNLIELSSYP